MSTCMPVPVGGLRTTAVRVIAEDAVTSAGLSKLLRAAPGISDGRASDPAVVLFAAPHTGAAAIGRLSELAPAGVPVLLLTRSVGEDRLSELVERGVVHIVDRDGAGASDLAEAVHEAAARRDDPPGKLLGELTAVARLMRRRTDEADRLDPRRLADREIEILRLLAHGAGTTEIAKQLAYSEGTVKHVLHTMTTRFGFRTRAHAVAVALRAGVL